LNSAFFFRDVENYDEKAAKKNLTPEAALILRDVVRQLDALAEWSAEGVHSVLNAIATAANVGLGKIAQPIRVAVTGTAVSPPIDGTLALLGKSTTLARIGNAINYIERLTG
jgi:glutamyl-tRNA synthetase